MRGLARLALIALIFIETLLATAASPPVPQERSVTVDGAAVRYTDIGAGAQGLVFVHGWSCNRSTWRSTLPAFSTRAHEIALDLPGHGDSPRPARALDMKTFVKAIEAVMKDAGMTKAVLVGHSNGAPMIRSYYRAHPDQTLALVSVDGPMKSFFADPNAANGFIAALKAPDYKDVVGRMVAGMTQPLAPDLAGSIRSMMLATPQTTMVEAFAATLEPGVWNEDPIKVPLLMVLAQQPAWSAEYEAYVRKLAPGVDYRVFEGVTHFLMLEKPEILNKSLAEFLDARGLFPAARP